MYNSLDALCKRFKISLAEREKHGALIDAKLLAAVYLELQGGRERRLDLIRRRRPLVGRRPVASPRGLRPAATPAGARASTEAERAAHAAFIRDALKERPSGCSFERTRPGAVS